MERPDQPQLHIERLVWYIGHIVVIIYMFQGHLFIWVSRCSRTSGDQASPTQCGPTSCQTSHTGGSAVRWCVRELFTEDRLKIQMKLQTQTQTQTQIQTQTQTQIQTQIQTQVDMFSDIGTEEECAQICINEPLCTQYTYFGDQHPFRWYITYMLCSKP